jgi:hypothetical protein
MRSANIANISQRRMDHVSWVQEVAMPQDPKCERRLPCFSRLAFPEPRHALPGSSAAMMRASIVACHSGLVGPRQKVRSADLPTGSPWRVFHLTMRNP